MPFDPNLPADGAPLSAPAMRGQLTSLNNDIQTRATEANLVGQINGTSSNTNGVGTLDLVASDPPTQGDVQATIDKLNELILTLRR